MVFYFEWGDYFCEYSRCSVCVCKSAVGHSVDALSFFKDTTCLISQNDLIELYNNSVVYHGTEKNKKPKATINFQPPNRIIYYVVNENQFNWIES